MKLLIYSWQARHCEILRPKLFAELELRNHEQSALLSHICNNIGYNSALIVIVSPAKNKASFRASGLILLINYIAMCLVVGKFLTCSGP